MKIQVREIQGQGGRIVNWGNSWIFPNVKDACIFVMERHKDYTDKLLEPLTLANLKKYADGYVVEKIDHSVRWIKIN